MGRVARRRRQDDLRVRRQFDVTGLVSVVDDRDSTCLGVVVRRDQYCEPGRNRAITPEDINAVFKKCRFIALGFHATRLVSRRPYGAAIRIAKKDVRAPLIARRVLAPAGHGEFTPAAVSGTRHSHHDGVLTVGEKLRMDGGQVRRSKARRGRRKRFVACIGDQCHLLLRGDYFHHGDHLAGSGREGLSSIAQRRWPAMSQRLTWHCPRRSAGQSEPAAQRPAPV